MFKLKDIYIVYLGYICPTLYYIPFIIRWLSVGIIIKLYFILVNNFVYPLHPLKGMFFAYFIMAVYIFVVVIIEKDLFNLKAIISRTKVINKKNEKIIPTFKRILELFDVKNYKETLNLSYQIPISALELLDVCEIFAIILVCTKELSLDNEFNRIINFLLIRPSKVHYYKQKCY